MKTSLRHPFLSLYSVTGQVQNILLFNVFDVLTSSHPDIYFVYSGLLRYQQTPIETPKSSTEKKISLI